MIHIHIHEEPIDDKCLLCGNKKDGYMTIYCRNSRPDLPNFLLKECDIITHCAGCRNLLNLLKETKKKLDFLENEVEYLKFLKDN